MYVTIDSSKNTRSWLEGHSLSLVNVERDSQTMFVWVCELYTPKPEHCCKINTDLFFSLQIDTLVEQVMIFLMVKKNRKSFVSSRENVCFNLPYCFILRFPQWYFVNLSVQIHL